MNKSPRKNISKKRSSGERGRTGTDLPHPAEEISLLYQISLALTGGQDLYHALRAFVKELKRVMIVDAFHIGFYDAPTDLFTYSLFLNLDEDLQLPPRSLRENPGLTWEVISGKRTIYLPDVSAPRTQEEYKIVVVRDVGIRSYIGIPLMLQDRVIGVMSVQALQPHAYTADQIRLLETLAAQVAITIEKGRLLDQVRKELEERKKIETSLRQREAILKIVAETGSRLLKASDWKSEIDSILESLGRTINASHAYLFENHLNDQGTPATSMRHEWTAEAHPTDLGVSEYQNVPLKEPDFEGWYEIMSAGSPYLGDRQHVSPEDLHFLQARGMKALLDVPIHVDGVWWGTIGFDDMDHSRLWSSAEVDALLVAANILGTAIERQEVDHRLQEELAQRKQLIAELAAKNAELERFTYTVSHDLKAPLFTIRGFLGYLEKDLLSGNHDQFIKDAQRIADATEKMQHLLNDLLELSRVGRLMNEPGEIQMGELVRDVLALVQGEIQERRAVAQVQEHLPRVYADRQRISEVLQNLVDNAVKFMGSQPDPRVEIGQAGEENGMPILYVRDNGIGISSEHFERVFGLFNKLDPKSEGTGIGLALVRRIIEFHGGRIWVESEAGKGSTFFFTLPTPPASSPALEPGVSGDQTQGKPDSVI
jgi:signal transduction histidine kinase